MASHMSVEEEVRGLLLGWELNPELVRAEVDCVMRRGHVFKGRGGRAARERWFLPLIVQEHLRKRGELADFAYRIFTATSAIVSAKAEQGCIANGKVLPFAIAVLRNQTVVRSRELAFELRATANSAKLERIRCSPPPEEAQILRVRMAVRRLTKNEMLALEAKALGVRFKELAAEVRIPEGTLRSAFKRGREKLGAG